MKKKWEKPKLQVIVRHQPEEKVLSFYKYQSSIGPTSQDICGNCKLPRIN